MEYKNVQIKFIKDFYQKAKRCQLECGFTSFNAFVVAAINNYMQWHCFGDIQKHCEDQPKKNKKLGGFDIQECSETKLVKHENTV